jgi:hypothetical protein
MLAREIRSLAPRCLRPAHEGESHSSFVERLRKNIIAPAAQQIRGDRGTLRHRMPAWPDKQQPSEQQKMLLANLFDKFFPQFYRSGKCRLDESSAASLASLSRNEGHTIYVVEHEISDWHAGTRPLIEWYCSFWAKVGREARADEREACPQFLVFLNVVYQTVAPSFWQRFRLGPNRAYDKARVQSELNVIGDALDKAAATEPECLWFMLDELACVKRDHVRSWAREHGYYQLEEDLSDFVKRIFESGQCQPMRVIEKYLEQERLRFADSRGGL